MEFLGIDIRFSTQEIEWDNAVVTFKSTDEIQGGLFQDQNLVRVRSYSHFNFIQRTPGSWILESFADNKSSLRLTHDRLVAFSTWHWTHKRSWKSGTWGFQRGCYSSRLCAGVGRTWGSKSGQNENFGVVFAEVALLCDWWKCLISHCANYSGAQSRSFGKSLVLGTPDPFPKRLHGIWFL